MSDAKGANFIREHMPLLDDWVDGHPDAWDYEAVLAKNNVVVEWCDQMTSDGVTFKRMPPDLCGWGFRWPHGFITLGQCSETIARKAAALFVSLWQRGVSACFCDKIMDGYVMYLEHQGRTQLTFQAEIAHHNDRVSFRLTRKDVFAWEPIEFDAERTIIEALNVRPDEEVIVTFSKRPRNGPA